MDTTLTISPKGLALIQRFEAFSARRYLCPAGKPSIGYGHVITLSEPQPLWDAELTREDAAELLRADLVSIEKYLNTHARIKLTQAQFDALCSFSYNVGLGALAKSTLWRQLNMGLIQKASSEFLSWIYVTDPRTQEKVRSSGLLHRRTMEKLLFDGTEGAK